MNKIRRGAALNVIGQILDQGLQFLAPIFLIRLVNADQFADYRILWLLVGTSMLFAPLGLPNSFQYFIPRLEREHRAMLVAQTLGMLILSGVLTATVLYLGKPLLPANVQHFLADNETLTLVFLVLWVVGSAIDTLANAHQDYVFQALIVSVLAILRALIIVGLAFLYHNIHIVYLGLIVFASLKIVMSVIYSISRDGLQFSHSSFDFLKHQLAYAVPFGLSSSLYSLRKYGEQWIVVALFSTQKFVAFSFAATAVLPVTLVQSAIGSTILAKLNDLHKQGQFGKLLELNRKANVVSSMFVLPTIVFLFVFAPEIVELLFTSAYLNAVPVIRIYLFQVLLGVDVGSLCSVYGMGKFMIRFAAGMLVVSLPISYLGGTLFGMIGTAYGSLLASVLGACIQYSAVARVVGVNLGRLQHWQTLFFIFGIAVGAIFPAYLILELFKIDGLILRLVFGAAIYGLTYVAIIIMNGRHKILTN